MREEATTIILVAVIIYGICCLYIYFFGGEKPKLRAYKTVNLDGTMLYFVSTIESCGYDLPSDTYTYFWLNKPKVKYKKWRGKLMPYTEFGQADFKIYNKYLEDAAYSNEDLRRIITPYFQAYQDSQAEVRVL